MSRRLDIGVASYGRNHQQLERTLQSIARHSVTDFTCHVIHNPSDGDELTRETICRVVDRDTRFRPVWHEKNTGYAGAVNTLLSMATTDRIGYVENDATILTLAWDETLCEKLDMFHELGWIFPNGGPYPIDRGNYTEVLWGVGFCWMLARQAMVDVGLFDEEIGHQNEVDYSTRLRLAGWKIAAESRVQVKHEASATNDPKSLDRINKGVVEWLNKWLRLLVGKQINYHSPNVLRFEDLHPTAIYMEQYWLTQFPNLNANPEVITVNGVKFDLIKVPRLSGFYRNRII